MQRARIVLAAHQYPLWSNTQLARMVGCARDTVQEWRRRWTQQGTVQARARAGAPRTFPALVRVQVVALACSAPRQYGKPWQRWSGEKLAQVVVEQGLVSRLAPSTIRRWLREDKIKPWRSHQRTNSPCLRLLCNPHRPDRIT